MKDENGRVLEVAYYVVRVYLCTFLQFHFFASRKNLFTFAGEEADGLMSVHAPLTIKFSDEGGLLVYGEAQKLTAS
jgi:hypothetical protein